MNNKKKLWVLAAVLIALRLALITGGCYGIACIVNGKLKSIDIPLEEVIENRIQQHSDSDALEKTTNKRRSKMDFEKYLYDETLSAIQKWNEKDIYAIVFLVNCNSEYSYKGVENFPVFSVGYNTEKNCDHAGELSEERWNIAFWDEDMTEIVSSENVNGAEMLLNWYSEKGITDAGEDEDEDECYDDEMRYIGKGPKGYYELLCEVSDVAKKLRSDGVIKNKFGTIPIIVTDYEYSWYVKEATENANQNGEADTFLRAMEEDFPD